MPDEVYSAGLGPNLEFTTSVVRVEYTSLVAPQLRGPADLTASAWCGLLLRKLVLVAGALALGAWHWRTAESRIAAGARTALHRSLAASSRSRCSCSA